MPLAAAAHASPSKSFRAEAAAIFLAAGLVFLIQPLIGRRLLPVVGGTSGVWAICLLFFQAGLLGGYLYAHGLARLKTPGRAAKIHAVVLLASLAWLPLNFHPKAVELAQDHPMAGILLLLVVACLGPYLAVTATSPLLQHWLAQRNASPHPYRLYALSNAGSFLGLIAYPFFVEPLLPLKTQNLLWSGMYAATVLLSLLATGRAWKNREEPAPEAGTSFPSEHTTPETHDPAVPVFWLLLPACSVMLLMSVSTLLTQDIAPIPLLWVLPLAVYLLSYTVCFAGDAMYPRWILVPAGAMALAGMLFLLHNDGESSILLQAIFLNVALAACCWVLHGELALLKPEPRQLTRYYLFIAAGGVLGGSLVALAAPLILPGYWELHAALAASAILTAACLLRGRSQRKIVRIPLRLIAMAMILIYTGLLAHHAFGQYHRSRRMQRNFYGVLHIQERIFEGRLVRSLNHGRINHGFQVFHDEELHRQPLSYYAFESGVGIALARHPKRAPGAARAIRAPEPLNVGVIGLGTGTLAAWMEKDDRITFYEINPLVEKLARTEFDYLKDCRGAVEVVSGDARLSLEREFTASGGRQYDVFVIDAFSGDAIPVHLLTREAFDLYRSHLAPGGLLAFHVSNRHLELKPVVRALTKSAGFDAVWVNYQEKPRSFFDSSDWIVTGENTEFFRDPMVIGARADWPDPPTGSPEPLWTDDHADLLGVVRF